MKIHLRIATLQNQWKNDIRDVCSTDDFLTFADFADSADSSNYADSAVSADTPFSISVDLTFSGLDFLWT